VVECRELPAIPTMTRGHSVLALQAYVVVSGYSETKLPLYRYG
jgi:hypothetical protein